MGKDQRLYAKFTLDFPEHEKILPLSDAAFRCLVEATIWSRKQQTDGMLARRLAVAKWSLDTLQELSTNDTEKPSLIECETGWLIRDFAEHQDTKAEIEIRRERNRLAGQLGGLTKAKRGAKRSASKSPSAALSENLAETETETHNSLTTHVVRENARAQRGSRLPDTWTPPPDVIAQMRSDHPNVDLKAEHAKFLDYWHGRAGKDARKVDWTATWRNWIRRAAEHQRNGNGTPHKLRTIAELAQQVRAEEQNTIPAPSAMKGLT